MTFWPDVCFCRSSRGRYAAEVGGEIPRLVDWEDLRWVGFQRKREERLADFAALITRTIRGGKPRATVAHQATGFLWDWGMGASVELAEESDYMSADFYGDLFQQSFYSKIFWGLSAREPFEFMTSRCPDLRCHTLMKSPDLLEAQTFAALSNDGGFLFVDAIDPAGKQNEGVYRSMGDIFAWVQPLEKDLGRTPCSDVAVYVSLESRCEPSATAVEVGASGADFGSTAGGRARSAIHPDIDGFRPGAHGHPCPALGHHPQGPFSSAALRGDRPLQCPRQGRG
jgi:hypothetical protein